MELLRQVLAEIKAGKRSFKPDDDSQASLENFQSVVQRLESAETRGYLKELRVQRSRGCDSFGLAKLAVVIGSLTFEGEQFLAAGQLNSPKSVSASSIFQVKPGAFGVSVDLLALYRWMRQKWWKSK